MSKESAGMPPNDFSVAPARPIAQRRSVFSSDYAGLERSHVMSAPEAVNAAARRSHKPAVIEDSLQLLDDLTNRPVDPLFEDATLLKGREQSQPSKVVTKIITLVVCILVGIGTTVAIQELNKDTRQKVREELANQVSASFTNVEGLNTDIESLKSEVADLSEQLSGETNSSNTAQMDALANGASEIKGPGLVVSLADPRESSSEKGSTPRDSTSEKIKTVSDTDLQCIVSLLWSGGAEGIAVNGVRLGVSSSVRAAGDAILVGVTPIQSPYTISAIGDKTALQKGLSSSAAQEFFASLENQGIYPSTSIKSSIALKAAGQPEVDYAERKK